MLIWIRQHKRKVAAWFVWPLVFVFIALYGSSTVSNRMAQNQRTAVWVNGERVTMDRFRAVEQEVNRLFSNTIVQPEKSRTQIALERSIEQEIAWQLADSLGLWTDDARVDQIITRQMSDGRGVFNQTYYTHFLAESGFNSHETYREFVRSQMDVQQALNYVRGTAVPSETDIQRGLTRESETRLVEMLRFDSRDYFDKVTPATSEVEDYFSQHIERYRFPKRMKIDYLEALPQDCVGEATPEDEKMERWFRSERERFLVPVERDASVIVFTPGSFRDDVTFTDADLRAYYESHMGEYQEPERFKARFMSLSVEVPDASIEAEMQKNPEEYLSNEEAVAARHILLKPPDGAGPEQTEETQRKIEEIRSRIHTEEDFIREAKAHSEDQSTNFRGGDLGYFTRNQMVSELAAAAFDLPEGSASAPVKTMFGYHIIWPYGRRAAGEMMKPNEARFRVLRNIDTAALKDGARGRLAEIKRELAEKSLAEASTVTELPVLETDWFSKGETPHPEAARDRFPFYQAVATLEPGRISDVVEGFSAFYLIETIEKQEPRQLPYEEVKEKVESTYRTEKAGDLAREKAREAAEKIRSGSMTFAEIPAAYGLPGAATYANLRAPKEEQTLENRVVDREIANRAFTVDEGQVEGPFDTLQGAALLTLIREEPEHLPDMDEVREKVETEYRKVLAERVAEDKVWGVWNKMEAHRDNLKSAILDAGLEPKTSEYFRPGDSIPGFPSNSVVNYVAANKRVVGATSEVLEDPPRNPDKPQPVRAYYLIQVATIEETRLPRFEEVAENVWDDLRLEQAAGLAKEDADKAVLELAEVLKAATGPLSASKSIDLKAFADEKAYEFEGPFSLSYGINVQGLPGSNSGASLSDTVFRLRLGGVSQVVPLVEVVIEGTTVGERIHGYRICQLVDVEPPPSGGSSRGEVFRALTSRLQDAVQGDWSERARLQSKIKLNEGFFSPEIVKELTRKGDKT